MKKNVMLSLAALLFTLTLSAFPHHAEASSTTTPPPDSDITRPTGKAPMVYMRAILAAGDVMLILLP